MTIDRLKRQYQLLRKTKFTKTQFRVLFVLTLGIDVATFLILVGCVSQSKEPPSVLPPKPIEYRVRYFFTQNIKPKINNILKKETPIISSDDIEQEQPDPTFDYDLYIKGVQHWEGFRSKPYRCSGGVLTIGYGFTGKEIKGRKYISKDTAIKELKCDVLPKYLKMVDEVVTVPLNEHQRYALACFTFNLGRGNLIKLVDQPNRLNDGNYESVSIYLAKYNRAGGKRVSALVLRRQWEIDVWSGNIHTNYGN